MGNSALDFRDRPESGAVSRRASLATFGATLLGVVAPVAARAGKKGKSNSNSKCKRQGEQCRVIVREQCKANQECLARLLPCCEFLARCAALKGLNCIDNAEKSQPPAP